MDIETGEEMAQKNEKPRKTIVKKKRAKKSDEICAICRNRIASFIKAPKKKRGFPKK